MLQVLRRSIQRELDAAFRVAGGGSGQARPNLLGGRHSLLQ